jgi:hypothetical protein
LPADTPQNSSPASPSAVRPVADTTCGATSRSGTLVWRGTPRALSRAPCLDASAPARQRSDARPHQPLLDHSSCAALPEPRSKRSARSGYCCTPNERSAAGAGLDASHVRLGSGSAGAGGVHAPPADQAGPMHSRTPTSMHQSDAPMLCAIRYRISSDEASGRGGTWLYNTTRHTTLRCTLRGPAPYMCGAVRCEKHHH